MFCSFIWKLIIFKVVIRYFCTICINIFCFCKAKLDIYGTVLQK